MMNQTQITADNMIAEIIQIEWEFFDKVNNQGGRAGCQDDYKTFYIMRKSQFLCWNEKLLSSYLRDLQNYRTEGENPLTLKYAYMMRFTAPADYEKIKFRLPVISSEKEQLAVSIAKIQAAWADEFYQTHPNLKNHARPIWQSGDSPYSVSIETYLLGELFTYSEKTLHIYADYVCQLLAEHKNLTQLTLEETAKAYGYGSAEEAERGFID